MSGLKRDVDAIRSKLGVRDDDGDPDDLFYVIGGPRHRKVLRRAGLPKSCTCLLDAVVGTDGVARQLVPGGRLVEARHREGCTSAS